MQEVLKYTMLSQKNVDKKHIKHDGKKLWKILKKLLTK